jgi:geranylgeranyl diphosphate synthase type II
MRDMLGHGPVADAAAYHLDTGGARVRSRLACDAAAALALTPAVATACAAAVELLHNASLVHDDVQEQDDTRRGRPAVWRKFGPAAAICVGDLMISAAYASLAAHPDPARAIARMHDAIASTARGQTQDLQASPTDVVGYRSIAAAKTGPLLALPVQLALCAAGAHGEDIAETVGARFAVAYQALDDIADRDADLAAGRINICTIFEAHGASPAQAAQHARALARSALDDACTHAAWLPAGVDRAYRNLADRLDSALTEVSDAA